MYYLTLTNHEQYIGYSIYTFLVSKLVKYSCSLFVHVSSQCIN